MLGKRGARRGAVRRILRNNGLSIVMFCLFALFLVGQSLSGFLVERDEQSEHGGGALTYGQYVTSGDFVEATFENWESEFLQMAAYVVFTIFLRQKGSSESKKLTGVEEVDADPRDARDKRDAPWPVRRGGAVLKLYENSLGLAFLLLFLMSFALHAAGGVEAYNHDEALHGRTSITTLQYLATARFWFESLQNWQSEFLAVFSIVVLSIFLRQRGSPESKPVATPHFETS
jgi:hypothetical protein